MSGLKILCSDGVQLSIDMETAKKFGTLNNMLSMTEINFDADIPLKHVSSKSLEKMVKFVEASDDYDKAAFFNSNFFELLDLMIAADYLDVPNVLNVVIRFVADKILAEVNGQFTASGYYRENICFRCFASESQKQLKTCQQCRIAQYCDRVCQAADWNNHKTFCKKILDAIKKDSDALVEDDDDMENMFGGMAGIFQSIFESLENSSRVVRALDIFKLAEETKSSRALKISVDREMNILRRMNCDSMGIRNTVPFLMLDLDLDDDAYNFIKWWLTIDPHGTYDWKAAPESKSADWLFLENQDKKEEVASIKHLNVVQFAAIILIKARMILKSQELKAKYESVLQKLVEESGKPQGQVENVFKSVKDNLDILSIEESEEQNGMLDKYLQKLYIVNRDFVKAIAEPGPFKRQEFPWHVSGPREPRIALTRSLHLFQTNSLLMTKIYDMVGKKPKA